MYVFNKLFLIISSSTNNSCGVQMETRLYVSAEFQTCKLFVKYHLEKTLVQMRILVVNISVLCFPELHATLETLRQRHRQRSGLCSRGTLCQSYFFRRQQSFCECLMMFCTPSPSFPPGLYTIFSTEMFVRLKIWSPRSNGPLKTAWRLSAGWIPRQKKQPKKRWEPRAQSHMMFFTAVTCRDGFCWNQHLAKISDFS